MLNTFIAVIREGKIEPLEKISLPEGQKVLVTLLPDKEIEFWLNSSQVALESIWNNNEDGVYDGLQETLYLLSTPANAEHLRQSIAEDKAGYATKRELIEQ